MSVKFNFDRVVKNNYFLPSAAISAKVTPHDPNFAKIWLGRGYEMIVPYLGTHLTEILSHISVGALFGTVALSFLLLLWGIHKLFNKR